MAILIIIGILIVMFVAAVLFSRILIKRAFKSVISSLRENQALTVNSARTPEELKLKSSSMLGNFSILRDYRPYVMRNLINEGVIQTTEDGKLFLSEEKLALSRWSQA